MSSCPGQSVGISFDTIWYVNESVGRPSKTVLHRNTHEAKLANAWFNTIMAKTEGSLKLVDELRNSLRFEQWL